jgi:hypothetical protein
MAYFTYTQKIWIMLILITLLFASLTNYPSTKLELPDNSPTTSYLWLTASIIFSILLICGSF